MSFFFVLGLYFWLICC